MPAAVRWYDCDQSDIAALKGASLAAAGAQAEAATTALPRFPLLCGFYAMAGADLSEVRAAKGQQPTIAKDHARGQ